MSSESIPLEFIKFAVVDRPACVWGPDVSATNLGFLRSLDPGFFLYQAKVHSLAMEDSDARSRQHAALALRVAYGMALEAFGALVGAVVQAPGCVFGWLSSYTNSELYELVDRLNRGQPVRALRPFRPATWEQVATVSLGPAFEQAPEEAPRLRDKFLAAWRRFGEDLASEAFRQEYNSLKHGFRVGPTPFQIRVGPEDAAFLETEAPFGHTFPYISRMPERGRRHHYNVGRVFSALEPTALAAALEVLACSMHNLVAAARAIAGDTKNNSIIFPEDATFAGVNARSTPITRLAYGGKVSVPDAEYCSEADVLAIYDETDEADAG